MKNIILKTISTIALILMMVFMCSTKNIMIPIVGMIVLWIVFVVVLLLE